jgi:signal peptidase II
MSLEAVQIVGFAVLFLVVYVILYRPVLRMLGERPSGSNDRSGTEVRGEDDDASTMSRQGLDAPAEESGRPRIRWYSDRLLMLTVFGVFLLDQVTKYLVRANLPLYDSWPSEGIFRLTHGTNSGTAFGLLQNQTLVLTVASVLAIGFLYYFYRTQALPSRLLRLAIGLQLGGAFGNLVDRLRVGAVVDFIDVGWWPVFNLADSSIVIGIGLLGALLLFDRSSYVQGQERRQAGSE